MKTSRLMPLLLAAGLSMLLGGPATAQTVSRAFGSLAATGTTATWSFGATLPVHHTAAVVVTGSPSACTVALEGSLDGQNWFSLSGDQDCSTSLMFHVAFRPVSQIRFNLSVLSGGTTPTVTARYMGVK